MSAGARRIRAVVAAVVAASSVAVALPAAATPPAPIGGGGPLTTPTSGSDISQVVLTTSGGCPSGTTDAYNVTLNQIPTGGGASSFPADFAVVTTTDAGYSTTSPIRTTVRKTFKDLAAERGLSSVPTGEYQLTFRCVDSFAQTTARTYTASIYFSTSTSYTSTPPGQQATTTMVTANPPSPSPAGTSVTFTATVTPSAAGTVQFKVDGTALGSPVTVSNGTATSTPTALAAGARQVTADFTPTDTTAATASSGSLTYNAQAVTSVALSATPASPSTFGTSVTFTATLSPTAAAGTVQFRSGSTNLGSPVAVTSGMATFTTASLSVGTSSITAAFSPTSVNTYTSSTSTALSYVVNPRPTTTTVTTSPGTSSVESTEVTITATVAPGLAGQVQFKVDGANLGSPATTDSATGRAVTSTTSLAVGARSITAVFTPTDAANNAGSTSDPVTYTVTAATPGGGSAIATTTTLAVSPASPQPQGTGVTLTATVAPSAAGTVAFFDGNTNLGSVPVSGGKASITTSTLPAGDRALRALYSPANTNAYSTSSSAMATFRVTTPTATGITLVVSPPSPQVRGTALTLTATVTPSVAVGSVQFLEGATVLGSAPVASGKASLTVPSPTVGTRSFTARFVPMNAADFSSSMSTALNFTSVAEAVKPRKGIPCQFVFNNRGRRLAVPRGCVPSPAKSTPCTYTLNSKTGRVGVTPKGCRPTPSSKTFCSFVTAPGGRQGVLPRHCVPVRGLTTSKKADFGAAEAPLGRRFE